VAVQIGLLGLRQLPVRLDIGRILNLGPLLADLDLLTNLGGLG
jgi:hypothetical protein